VTTVTCKQLIFLNLSPFRQATNLRGFHLTGQ